MTARNSASNSQLMRESDVRQVVKTRLWCEHYDDPSTKIVDEMGIWSSSVRIDIAVINGQLAGYELKSARDNLDRLPRQVSFYNDVFDTMTLVVAENHLAKAVRLIPPWWGLIVASSSASSVVTLTDERPANKNSAVKPIQLARLLWKDECLEILNQYNLLKGFRSQPLPLLHERIAEHINLEMLANEVRTSLKRRIRVTD